MQNQFKWTVRALKFTLALFQLLVSITAFAIPELYTERPDILRVEAKGFPENEIPVGWKSLREGHLEAVAELFGLYSDPSQHLYFIARDAELFYDYARLMATIVPEFSKFKDRIHVLNISRSNMNKSGLSAYLSQEGISGESLQKGMKPVFVDVGFVGSISKKIEQKILEKLQKNKTIEQKTLEALRKQMMTHLMCSLCSSHPSSRVFLQSFNSNSCTRELAPSVFQENIRNYEKIPRFTYRSTRFEKVGETWIPAGDIGVDKDGTVNRDQAVAYMADLKEFAIQSAKRFSSRVQEWSQLFSKAYEIHQTPESWREELRKEFKVELKSEVSTPELIKTLTVRDFLEAIRLNYPDISKSLKISEESVGLQPVK